MQNNTSIEEDTELRDLVAQTLENRGILPKIRAQLRASVFCALEENSGSREAITGNDDLSAFMKLPLAAIVLNLVREFFEVLQLDFTLSVFEPETNFGKDYTRIAKDTLMKHFNIEKVDCKNSILYEILARAVHESESHAKGDVKDETNLESNLILNLPDSPDLNSTYVKKPIEESSPLGNLNLNKPFEDIDENYDSIDEVLPSNKTSSSDHSAAEAVHEEKTNYFESLPISKTDEKLRTLLNHVENNQPAAEFDLLTFTPVKEVKTAEKCNSDATAKNEEKTKSNPLSVLGDLPPLNAKTESKKNQMNEIKAIIDQGLDLDKSEPKSSSVPSSKDTGNTKSPVHKVDKSQNSHVSEKSEKSETIDGDEFDEDDDNLSDLINSRASSDNQFTVDETISKVSNVGDHLESI